MNIPQERYRSSKGIFEVKCSPTERFWRFVDKNGPVIYPELGKCWIWTGGTNGKYGWFWNGKVSERASKFSYNQEYGLIPDGKEICHRCDNPICINPKHLYAGTRSQNVQDCVRRGRHVTKIGLWFKEHPRLFGEKNGNSRLTQKEVSCIRKSYIPRDREYGRTALSNIFGVSESTIMRITTKRNWDEYKSSS